MGVRFVETFLFEGGFFDWFLELRFVGGRGCGVSSRFSFFLVFFVVGGSVLVVLLLLLIFWLLGF